MVVPGENFFFFRSQINRVRNKINLIFLMNGPNLLSNVRRRPADLHILHVHVHVLQGIPLSVYLFRLLARNMTAQQAFKCFCKKKKEQIQR